MKTILASLLLGFCLSTASAQQSTGKATANTDKMKATLIKLDQDWCAAGVRNDIDFTKKIVADDCLFTEYDGSVLTKDQVIKEMESGTSKTISNQPSKYSVRFFGPDVAVLRHNSTSSATNNGKDASGEFRRMHVFVHRNGRWTVVDSQSVRVGPITVAAK